MGKLEVPERREEWDLVDKYEVDGHTVEIRSGGYLHLAGFVDGELVIQDQDVPAYIREETERHAKYLASSNDSTGEGGGDGS